MFAVGGLLVLLSIVDFIYGRRSQVQSVKTDAKTQNPYDLDHAGNPDTLKTSVAESKRSSCKL